MVCERSLASCDVDGYFFLCDLVISSLGVTTAVQGMSLLKPRTSTQANEASKLLLSKPEVEARLSPEHARVSKQFQNILETTHTHSPKHQHNTSSPSPLHAHIRTRIRTRFAIARKLDDIAMNTASGPSGPGNDQNIGR